MASYEEIEAEINSRITQAVCDMIEDGAIDHRLADLEWEQLRLALNRLSGNVRLVHEERVISEAGGIALVEPQPYRLFLAGWVAARRVAAAAAHGMDLN